MKRSKTRLLAVLAVMVMVLTASVVMTACGSDQTKDADRTDVKTEQTSESHDTDETAQEKASEEAAGSTSETKKSESSSASKSSEKSGTKSTQATQATQPTKATQATNAAVCYVSVEGYCSGKAITLQGGDTAYSVLKKTGATVSAENTSMGIYVKGINGRFASGSSGWKYSVNGSEPNYSAGSYSVKSGDTVKWYWGSAY